MGMPKPLAAGRSDAQGKVFPAGAGKRVAVLGAGYLGSALALEAALAGWKVKALTRNRDLAARLRDRGIETIVADLADAGWHGDFSEGADLAVVCVGAGAPDSEAYRRSYVGGMTSVVGWSRSAALGMLIYTSSTSVYPQGAADGEPPPVIDESFPVAAGEERSGILVRSEALAREASAGRVVVLRLAGIYGPGRHSMLDLVRSGKARLPGAAGIPMNMIHRDDIVGAIGSAWNRTEPGTRGLFNVTDGAAATRAEVASWLASRLGRPAPEFDGSSETRRRPQRNRIISNRRIRDTFGWEPLYSDFRVGFESIIANSAGTP